MKSKTTGPAYEAFKRQQAEISRQRSAAGRDIADEFPAVAHPKRKARARRDFEYFCRTYLPDTFNLAWSDDHRTVISKMQRAALEGGQFAVAMPRGFGKTSLSLAAVLWSLLYGHRRFVALIAAEQIAALQLLDSVRTDLECNDTLAEDFPEVCYPIRRLDGISHRANGQTFKGERTHITWTGDEIVLPSIPGSVASAGIVRVAGITGRIRGMNFARPDGKKVRPDLVIIDDPQTDESARSPAQTMNRLQVIGSAILGLAGPGKKIAAVMPCTVIYPDDLADQVLDRKKYPQWQGERTRLVRSLPRNEKLWEQYAEIRADSLRAGNQGKEATEFYRANREAMDEGAEVAWPLRFNPDEASAVQNAMNLRIDNPAAFAAEQQNEPLRPERDAGNLSSDTVGEKINGRPRGIVPEGCEHLTAFVDVQGTMLFWVVCAWQKDFTGYIVDYGAYPDPKRPVFTLREVKKTLQTLHPGGQEAAIYAGLNALSDQLAGREWKRADGALMRVDRMAIDAGFETKSVELFVRQSKHAAILLPSFGKYIGATTSPMALWPGKDRAARRSGWHWMLERGKTGLRHLLIDTNHWKSFVCKAFLTPQGAAGCLSVFGNEPREHELLGLHLTSEYRQAVSSRGRTVDEWKLKPGSPDNHWFDCLVGCAAVASLIGCTTHGAADDKVVERRRLKLSELQRQKQRR